MVGRGNALTAFDQRPDFASAIEDGLQALEQRLSPNRFVALYSRFIES
jgi:hypothetical protein